MENKEYGTLQKLKDELSVDWSEISRKEDITYLRYLTNLKVGYDEIYKDLINEVHYAIKELHTDKGRADYQKFTHWQEQNDLINDFLKTEIEKEKVRLEFSRFYTAQPQPLADVPQLDFSDIALKERVIILEKYGYIDYTKTLQTNPETISHTSEILSAISGIRASTLNTYINPMLQPIRDDFHKDSPYNNPANLLNAEKTMQKLKTKNIDANR